MICVNYHLPCFFVGELGDVDFRQIREAQSHCNAVGQLRVGVAGKQLDVGHCECLPLSQLDFSFGGKSFGWALTLHADQEDYHVHVRGR